MKIALVGSIYQGQTADVVRKLFDTASIYDARFVIPDTFYNFLRDSLCVEIPPCEVVSGDDFDADVIVCIGGDGTFLSAAGKVGSKQIPILGINTGRLGFLASFSPEDMEDAVACICGGRYEVEDRSVLHLSCDEMELGGFPFALNEIAILKHDIASMISIHTRIDGEYLTTYQADGLIVSTPTGSTAYSLSVGGPIIVPQSDTVSLTPVAPHSLNMRPIVLCDTSEIELCVESRSHNFLISVDGRSKSYPEKIHLRIRKADYVVKVITRPKETFFSTLREKMMWGADNRHK
ncbi:MAG: NAD kinase [Bacteroides sp.]|nr:NAD kinase [Bacteroides sp.]MCM1419850.1 NAD kinase [Bacteroides sp.]